MDDHFTGYEGIHGGEFDFKIVECPECGSAVTFTSSGFNSEKLCYVCRKRGKVVSLANAEECRK